MIGSKLRLFTCDDCGFKYNFHDIDQARKNGWAVARDRQHCYCPACAPARRSTGCCGRQQTKRLNPRRYT